MTNHAATALQATDRRRVMVTGAAGFLGSHVVEMLSAAGRFDVIATDLTRNERAESLARLPGVTFTAADLRDTAAIEELIAGSHCAVHLAAVRTTAAAARPRDAHDVNVGAAYDLISLAAQHDVARLIIGSTHSVYGAFEDPDVEPFTEDRGAIRRGLSMYAASKLASEAFVEAFANTGGANYLSLRFGTIYGPRANLDSTAGILLEALMALDRGEKAAIPWQRDALHALVYVEDAARAVVRALEVDEGRMAINVVGEPVTSEVLYTTLARLYGHDSADLDWRDERTRYQLVSAERMQAVLGIRAATSLEDGLTSLIADYRSRGSLSA